MRKREIGVAVIKRELVREEGQRMVSGGDRESLGKGKR